MDNSHELLVAQVQRAVPGERVVDVVPGNYWSAFVRDLDDAPVQPVAYFAVLEADWTGTGTRTRRIAPVFVDGHRLFVDAGCCSVILATIDDGEFAVEDEMFQALQRLRCRSREARAHKGRDRGRSGRRV